MARERSIAKLPQRVQTNQNRAEQTRKKSGQAPRIEEVMVEIEKGQNPRPEFFLAFPDNAKRLPVYAAALFCVGGGGIVDGWFIWHMPKERPNLQIYCTKESEKRLTDYKQVMLSGAPSKVSEVAILTRSEAAKLLESLAKGETTTEFEILPGKSVFGRDQN